MKGQSEHAMTIVIIILVAVAAYLVFNIIIVLSTGSNINTGCKIWMQGVWDSINTFTGGSMVPFTVLCDIVTPSI